MDADIRNVPILTMRRSYRRMQALASWKVWLPLLVLSLAAIVISIAVPAYTRWEALNYLDEHRVRFGFTDESEWITERFGERARGLSSVEYIVLARIPADGWSRVAVLNETTCIIGSLNFEPVSIPPQGVDALRQLISVKSIKLDGPNFTDEILTEFLSARPPLNDVQLSSTTISRRALWELSHISSIERLDLYYNLEIEDDDFRELAPLPKLLEADIDSCLADEGLKWLSQSPLLRQLHLSRSTVTNAGLSSLAKLTELTDIRLMSCPNVGPEGIAHLEQLPRLASVGLESDCITWETIKSFRQMPSLHHIFVMGAIPTDMRTAMEREWEVVVWELPILNIETRDP